MIYLGDAIKSLLSWSNCVYRLPIRTFSTEHTKCGAGCCHLTTLNGQDAVSSARGRLCPRCCPDFLLRSHNFEWVCISDWKPSGHPERLNRRQDPQKRCGSDSTPWHSLMAKDGRQVLDLPGSFIVPMMGNLDRRSMVLAGEEGSTRMK